MNNILLIGTGGCGGKLVDQTAEILKERMDLKNTYNYIFMNSNQHEMIPLKNCIIGTNTIFVSGAGTGKNRDMAMDSMKIDRVNIFNKLGIASEYKAAYIISSSDGGFGSGSVMLTAQALKSFNPEIKVNLIIVSPKKRLSKQIECRNTISLYEEIQVLLNDEMIDSYQIIDNDKMRDREDVEKFNRRAMGLFITSLEMPHDSLDANDSLLINSAKGYKIILPISKDAEEIDEAVKKAKEDSPFIIPDKTKAARMYGIYDKNKFSEEDINYEYEIRETQKLISGERTIFVVTGLGSPNKEMNKYNKLYKKLIEEENEEDDEEDEFVSFKADKDIQKSKKEKEEPVSKKEALKKLIANNLWD